MEDVLASSDWGIALVEKRTSRNTCLGRLLIDPKDTAASPQAWTVKPRDQQAVWILEETVSTFELLRVRTWDASRVKSCPGGSALFCDGVRKCVRGGLETDRLLCVLRGPELMDGCEPCSNQPDCPAWEKVCPGTHGFAGPLRRGEVRSCSSQNLAGEGHWYNHSSGIA